MQRPSSAPRFFTVACLQDARLISGSESTHRGASAERGLVLPLPRTPRYDALDVFVAEKSARFACFRLGAVSCSSQLPVWRSPARLLSACGIYARRLPR